MKKLLLLLGLIGLLAMPGKADVKNFKELYHKYENDTEVKCVNVNRFLNGLISMYIPDEGNEVAKQFMSSCSEVYLMLTQGERQKVLKKEVSDYIRKSKLEELVSIREEDTDIRIYAKSEGEKINSLLVVIDGNDSVAFLQANGEFSPAMLKELAKSN